jgi:hypothetical protein
MLFSGCSGVLHCSCLSERLRERPQLLPERFELGTDLTRGHARALGDLPVVEAGGMQEPEALPAPSASVRERGQL